MNQKDNQNYRQGYRDGFKDGLEEGRKYTMPTLPMINTLPCPSCGKFYGTALCNSVSCPYQIKYTSTTIAGN